MGWDFWGALRDAAAGCWPQNQIQTAPNLTKATTLTPPTSLRERDEAKTKNLADEEPRESRRDRERRAAAGLAAPDRAALVPVLRDVSRQEYLARREADKLAALEDEIRDEEFLFAGGGLGDFFESGPPGGVGGLFRVGEGFLFWGVCVVSKWRLGGGARSSCSRVGRFGGRFGGVWGGAWSGWWGTRSSFGRRFAWGHLTFRRDRCVVFGATACAFSAQ